MHPHRRMPQYATSIVQPGRAAVLLALLLCICSVDVSSASDFVPLTAEYASQVPARLVFSQQELVQCVSDPTGKICVLRAPIVISKDTWRQSLPSTGGTAVVTVQKSPQRITSEPCTASGACLSGVRDANSLLSIVFSQTAGVILVETGAVLIFSNLQLLEVAPQKAYHYSPALPYKSVGAGSVMWPSIVYAPRSTVVLVNVSVAYYNPSTIDSCSEYAQKRLFLYKQVNGEDMVASVNATTNRIIGPFNNTAVVRNGSSDEILGNATVTYQNVSFTCVPLPPESTQSGLPTGALVAAIVVPVVVGLLAIAALLACCYLKRQRRRRQQQQQPPSPKDIEAGGHSGVLGSPYDVDLEPGAPAPDVMPSAGSKGQDMVVLAPVTGKAPSGGQDQGAFESGGNLSTVTNYSTQVGSDSSLPEPQQFGTGATADAGSASRTASDDRYNSSVAALLKARSDVAVLRDLKIGPLLGRGSYGRVYRGRWKATTVAVKIIEHQNNRAGAHGSGDQHISAGRESLLAMSISHPNVVTTYHISTMSMSQRHALASSWLAESGAGPSSSAATAPEPSAAADDVSTDGSTASSGFEDEEPPPDLLETWIIMEFCERGSLERAIKLGRFGRRGGVAAGEGQGGGGGQQQEQQQQQRQMMPEMVPILKALFDVASGLDYLHSIGVVHGDLKTANVLLKGSTRDARGFVCKITDFGLSRVLDMEASHISTGTHGTIVYVPKELLLSGRMTQATDIYSFGLMMWELFSAQPVMEAGLSIGQMFYMIAYQNWRPDLPPDCPPGYAELMQACWHEDPAQRPTAQQLLRRVQKLYGQAKQRQQRGTGSSRAGRAPAAGAAASAAAGTGAGTGSSSTARPSAAPGRVAAVQLLQQASPFAIIPQHAGTGARAAQPSQLPAAPVAAAAATLMGAAGAVTPPTQQSEVEQQQVHQQQPQQPRMQQQPTGQPAASYVDVQRAASWQAPSTGSAGTQASSMSSSMQAGPSAPTSVRPSTSSSSTIGEGEGDGDGEYQPYVQAVMQRYGSMSPSGQESPGPQGSAPAQRPQVGTPFASPFLVQQQQQCPPQQGPS